MKEIVIAAMLLVATLAGARAEGTVLSQWTQKSVPLAHLDGIRTWRADGNTALFVEGNSNVWYRAQLSAPCSGLSYRDNIGFVIQPSDNLDRFSAIVVAGQVCQVASLTRVDKPM